MSRTTTVGEPRAPLRPLTIFNRPPLLFVRGEWDDEKFHTPIAVVGTRRASENGLRRAQRLVTDLVAAGYSILSGLATGIDTCAHRTALDCDGATAAVIGTVIQRQFPKKNTGLAEQIVASGGALLSQFLPQQLPTS